MQLPLDALALGDVRDEGDGDATIRARDVTEADLDRELGAILAPAGEVEADCHRADAGLGEIARAVRPVDPHGYVRGAGSRAAGRAVRCVDS
jgi:hypothetical protein